MAPLKKDDVTLRILEVILLTGFPLFLSEGFSCIKFRSIATNMSYYALSALSGGPDSGV